MIDERRLFEALDEALERRLVPLERRLSEFIGSLPATEDHRTDALLTVHELAELLHCDPRTVRRLELTGEVPSGIRIGGSKRWRTSDVSCWLDQLGSSGPHGGA